MRNKDKVLSAIIALGILATACDGRRGPGSQTQTNSNERGPDVSIRLGKEQAITKVQLFLEQREGSVTVQLPYTHLETTSVPCSQMDVDTDPNKGDEFMARCKPIGGSGPGAPYGSKTVSESKTECCKPKTVRWTTLQPTWTAEYSKETDSWSVNMEFDVDTVKKAIGWTVNDKSGAVTEKPGEN
jgi:hypothetical protein